MKHCLSGWLEKVVVFAAGFLLLSSAISRGDGTKSRLLHPEKLVEMNDAIDGAIALGRCPGAVLWVENGGEIHRRAYGKRAIVPKAEPMTEDTIFDAASLTKVVATTPAIMLLVERGKVKLDERVIAYIPEFTGGGKEDVTVMQLLTHVSGLRPDISLKPEWSGYNEAIRLSCAEKLIYKPGEKSVYSDTGPILLGQIVRRVSGRSLNVFLRDELYVPLGMKDSGFNPPAASIHRIAPTEVEAGIPVRGIVHDPRARRMGGVAGHAGLFLTASDLARYARMLLNGGELDGVRIFKEETVKWMTGVRTPETISIRRGLGWDIDSGFSSPRGGIFPIGSYGHTGWTGTSIWIDPFSKSFVILLSNRNHPSERGTVSELRATLGTLAAEAVADFNFHHVPGALAPRSPAPDSTVRKRALPTLNGIDVLAEQRFEPLRGKRVGLVTNHTGHDRTRNPTIDLLASAPDVTLVSLLSPEHGIRGVLDGKVGDATDEKTGLKIHSLYGEHRKPTAKQLEGIDALVIDLQDIGCRFYTYISTMGLCLEAAAELGIPLIVLDRVNPINGTSIDGPVLEGKTTFVGFHPIPLRHGMTMGELARMINAETGAKTELRIIGLQHWRRDSLFDETGLPWTNPSPNMRNLNQAILYPGIGLLEDAISVGRGTDTPFEVVGAPYIDDVKFARELNLAGLPGVAFVPVRFTPTTSTHGGKECGGVHIILHNRERCRAVDVGLLIARVLHRLYPADFDPDKMKHLLLHPPTLAGIRKDHSLDQIRATWAEDLRKFETRRKRYLLYPWRGYFTWSD
jgi:uncharacterized protein YbbC (DUF1343 family)/CubicO group peptidase (beta-lactamase class C family)